MKAEYLESARQVFTDAYVSTALEDVADQCGIPVDCGEDCNGGHAGGTLSTSDLASATLERLERDAREFFDAHTSDLAMFPGDHWYGPDQWAERGGHFFWLTRSGSGSGFGDWYENGRAVQDPDMIEARDRLAAACRTEGERDLYRGTDDKIHHGKSWGEIQRVNY